MSSSMGGHHGPGGVGGGGVGGGGVGGGGPKPGSVVVGGGSGATGVWLVDDYRTLSDVVRGIRACKRDVSLYISQVIAEIKVELQSTNPRHKANGLQKLTFLQMMGYNVSDWSSFAIIEVMSSPVFAHKRIGYLAASQTFTPKTQVILLATNLLQKELRGGSSNAAAPVSIYQAGLAINCISNIVTEELARDLLPDLERLLSHSHPYLRKKAVLCLYKIFLRWPQALRLEFSKIQSILETDTNPAVVSCAVNVITELSTKNPNNYLPLAPSFFQLLTSSTNNWMLIKVVKLLGSLVPEEPRLARKLLEPLSNIVKSTQAKSLLYEAVYTITLCLPYCVKADGSRPAIIPEVVALCSSTLTEFLQEADQNLKYLGLVGFGSLLESHPKVLTSGTHRQFILACLSDEDVTIRTRALELVRGLATKRNVMDLLTQLLRHVDSARSTYKTDLVDKVISICSAERRYTLLLPDDPSSGTGLFEWYVGKVLLRLAQTRGIAHVHGPLIQSQLQDVALRVPPVRTFCVECMMSLLCCESYVVPHALPAAAWIVGEYSARIPHVEETTATARPFSTLVKRFVSPDANATVSPTTQATFLQAAMKVLSTAASLKSGSVSNGELEACLRTLHKYLPLWMESLDVEVKERAFTARQMLLALDLTAPHLTTLDPDEDDDDEGEEEAEEDMLMGTGSKTTSSSNVADRCRKVAPTLTYLYVADPMMPVSIKAQRKERLALANSKEEGLNLDEPCQGKVFKSLLQEDEAAFPDSMGMESVSFSPHQPPPPSAANARNNDKGRDSPPRSKSAQPGDPFYLNSSSMPTTLAAADVGGITSAMPATATGNTEGTTTATATTSNAANLFGAIELGDEEDDDDDDGKKKKKKKKNRKKKGMDSADLSALGGGVNKSVALFVDDDDDDDDEDLLGRGKKKTVKDDLAKVDLSTPLREDEFIPQREHYVVPERSSRDEEGGKKKKKKKTKKKQKEEEEEEDLQQIAAMTKKSKKETTKTQKKKKKQKEEEQASPFPDATGDLLGFGGMLTAAPAAPPAPTSNLLSMGTDNGSSSRISSAFDDLLNLSAPPAPPMATTTPTPEATLLDFSMPTTTPAPAPLPTGGGGSSNNKSATKRLWQRGTLQAKGAGPVNWDQVSILFRTYKQGKKSVAAASVTFKVVNMNDIVLENVQVQCEGQVLELGTIEPGNASESSTKVGPFTYGKKALGHQVTGQVTCGGGGAAASFSLALPATMHLQPVAGLTTDQVSAELQSGQDWCSSVVKLNVSSLNLEADEGDGMERLETLLFGFWRAEKVQEEESSGGGMVAMGAAASTTGLNVRFLLKWNPSSEQVKMDIKVSGANAAAAAAAETLAKTLAADGKRIVV